MTTSLHETPPAYGHPQPSTSSFSTLFWAHLVILFDLRINGVDLLPDMLGSLLIVIALGSLTHIHPYFSRARVIAFLLLLVIGAEWLSPSLRAVPTLGSTAWRTGPGDWTFYGDLREVVNVQALASLLDLLLVWYLCSGIGLLAAAAAQDSLASTARRRRNWYVLIACGQLVLVPLLITTSVGGSIIFVSAALQFVTFLGVLGLLRQVSALSLVPTRPISRSEKFHPVRWVARRSWPAPVLLSSIGVAILVLLWLNVLPCTWLDRAVGKSGCYRLLQQHATVTTQATFAANGELVSSSGGVLTRWNINAGTPQATFGTKDGLHSALAVAQDGQMIAAAQDGAVAVFDDGLPTVTLPVRIDDFGILAFHPDGRLLAVGMSNGTVQLWRIPDGTLHSTLRVHSSDLTNLTFSADGTVLLSSSRNHLIHVVDGTVIRSINEAETWDAAISADGALIAVRTRTTIRRVADGVELRTWRHQDDVGGPIVFSPDGTRLVTVATEEERALHVWHVADGTLRHAVSLPHTRGGYAIRSLAWSPESTLIAVSCIGAGQGWSNVALYRMR